MRLVLLGPPGAGKGTQAQLLSDELGVPHISTGSLFRTHIGEDTPLGREAQRYLDAGDLVPSHVTNTMVAERIYEPDAVSGFVLDGYPRTVDQAEALEKMVQESGRQLDAVVSLEVPADVVMARMMGRGRADDTEAVISNRLRVYREETEPLLHYYGERVLGIDGVGEVTQVNARVLAALQPLPR